MIHILTKKKLALTNDFHLLSNIDEILNTLKDEKIICLDTETTHLDPLIGKIVMLQLGTIGGDQYIIDNRDYNIKELKPLLENKDITFVLHNAKFDYNMLKRYDIILPKVYDTMIVDQVIFNGKYSIGESSKLKRFSLAGVYKYYFDIEIEKDTRNEFISIKKAPFTERQIVYGANDVIYPLKIKEKQEELISIYDLHTTVRLENEFVLVVGDMEYNGFKINTSKLTDIIETFVKKREEALKKLDSYLISKDPKYKKDAFQLDLFGGYDTKSTFINWNSDQQVLKILRETFGINAKDKYGNKSTGKDALEQLDEEFYDPIIKMILEYREADKIVSSFGETYIKKYLKQDCRFHTSFNQIVSTGRMSSRDPNMQQVPSNGEYRSCFVADEGNLLSCADYSSQESRIMAGFSKDESYIDFFNNQEKPDPHSYVATQMFSVAFKKEFIVTATNENKEYRHKGKTLNFGISYGMSNLMLSKRLHISEKEAQELIDLFYNTFPSLNTLFRNARTFGVENGFIRTNNITKRIRWFPEWEDLKKLNLKDFKNKSEYAKIKGKIERRSQNTIIQGSASDMTKISLVLLRKRLLEEGIRPLTNAPVKIIMTIHDETIIEASKDSIEYYSKIQKECMEKAGTVICKEIKHEANPIISEYWKH